MQIEELIAALEKATEGSWEMDLWISHLAGKHGTTAQHNDAFDCVADGRKFPALKWLPAYTTSLDAALTLVPEDCAWMAGIDYEQPGIAHVNWPGFTVDDRPRNYNAQAATPALALCIASLLARQAKP